MNVGPGVGARVGAWVGAGVGTKVGAGDGNNVGAGEKRRRFKEGGLGAILQSDKLPTLEGPVPSPT